MPTSVFVSKVRHRQPTPVHDPNTPLLHGPKVQPQPHMHRHQPRHPKLPPLTAASGLNSSKELTLFRPVEPVLGLKCCGGRVLRVGRPGSTHPFLWTQNQKAQMGTGPLPDAPEARKHLSAV
ncbi:Hypothetical predicted protein [Pelobates cultripes]|uniref:Uncharacterized protein n=1 Tax=Pelobates cultripes TaxID=61616 RepID=A0AAD1REZ9_PELCU|nr:Hypothetical predicted protein [Pelobates cultripes]